MHGAVAGPETPGPNDLSLPPGSAALVVDFLEITSHLYNTRPLRLSVTLI